MPTLNSAAQGLPSCRDFAAQMETFFGDRKPDLVIMSADWLEYGRSSRFGGMIADIKQTIAALNGRGIAIALLGPSVQFRSRLPSMLLRAHLRQIEPRPEDFILPDIFSFDERMRAALPESAKFSFVSIVTAVCPARQCPITVGEGIPLSFDHAHLTAEGSAFVAAKIARVLGSNGLSAPASRR
jgi:hypothetical protein